MNQSLLQTLNAARAAKRPIALATDLDSGAQALVTAAEAEGELATNAAIVTAARKSLAEDRSGIVEIVGVGKIFIQSFSPPLRLIIVGAVHIAQPLARMAAVAGYDVTVVDPRGSFATTDRFPGVTLSSDWPDEAVKALQPDGRTAVVTLTHDPKLDDPALAEALQSEAFYVGALGSRKTHAMRMGRLKDLGIAEDTLQRIHGPVGLDLGAVTPAEIAVSILAQLVKTLRHEEAA